MDTVHLAIQYKEKAKGIIVGLDLSGDPKVSIKTTVLLMDKKAYQSVIFFCSNNTAAKT